MIRLHAIQTDSTMTLLGKNPQATLVTADFQTCGRGQTGHSWHSRPGENLLVSLRLRPEGLSVTRRFRMMQQVALALCGTLEDFGIRAGIKWPNDIYVGDRKVCGFIIENKIVGERITECLTGIGLNVNQTEWPATLPNPVSMRQAAGQKFDREKVLQTLLGHIVPCPALYENEDRNLHARYMDALYRRTGIHPYTDADGPFNARISDVAPDGRLILECDSGQLRAYGLREVTFAAK